MPTPPAICPLRGRGVVATSALASPASDASVETLVDWLEFEAFFSVYGVARIDEVSGAIKIQEEEANDNIGAADALHEQFRLDVENEFARRTQQLGAAYPFELSNDGEELVFRRSPEGAPSFYLLCLVLSHVTRSPILLVLPKDAAVRDVRQRHFQILSTLAVAGVCEGPSLSLGWPRPSGDSILEVVARGCELSQTGSAKAAPGSTASPAAKDGGIDVLAWSDHYGRPPPNTFWFGQAASGHGWPTKSSMDVYKDFIDDYYLEQPRCNSAFVTVCPFIISDGDLARHSLKHGTLLDRLRAPANALRGVQLARGGTYVEEFDNARKLAVWLGRYRQAVRAA